MSECELQGLCPKGEVCERNHEYAVTVCSLNFFSVNLFWSKLVKSRY